MTMAYDKFKNVFTSDSGDLINKVNCNVMRKQYSYTFSRIETSGQLRATIRNGSFTFPGGYPMYLLFGDGEACCFSCAQEEYRTISKNTKDGYDASFQIVACDINYEDESLYCSHCNDKIESAYGQGDEE